MRRRREQISSFFCVFAIPAKSHTLIMQRTIYDTDGQPIPGAKVEVRHCDTRGFFGFCLECLSWLAR